MGGDRESAGGLRSQGGQVTTDGALIAGLQDTMEGREERGDTSGLRRHAVG